MLRRPLIYVLIIVATVGLLLRPTAIFAKDEHFLLGRPIPRPGLQSRVDRGLPFGWDRYGKSPLHHGVDFPNGLGVPVVAAADGTVFFAGADSTTQIGPSTNFYGNAVILTHDISVPGGQFSTLYGHLDKVMVTVGQQVKKGQQIGTVGKTGIALWYHLHFEVRIGNPQDYNSVVNPELWYAPQPGRGNLVGRVVNSDGTPAMGIRILVARRGYRTPGFSYKDPTLHSDPAYNENFVIGDIPSGCYQVSTQDNSGDYIFRQNACIVTGQNTVITVAIGTR